jgi:excisionase family DNA binding protein
MLHTAMPLARVIQTQGSGDAVHTIYRHRRSRAHGFSTLAQGADRLTYTVPEAGLLLGISRGAAYAAAADKTLPTIRIGRRLLVPRAALQRLLERADEEVRP